MRRALPVLALLIACDADVAVDEEVCSADARRLLDGDALDLDDAALPSLAGEHVVFVAEVPRVAYSVDTCGGAPVPLDESAADLSGAFALLSDAGPLAIGHRPDGAVVRLDRLDDPGLDPPRPIASLDPLASGWFRWPTGVLLWSGPLDGTGRARVAWYPGPDGPDAPAAELADDVVWLARGGLDTFLALTADGELLHLHDGARTSLHPHVRRAALAPDGAQAAWLDEQAAVSLHTLATGATRLLSAPQATLVRSAAVEAAWLWTDGAVARLDGAGAVVEVHARADGARLADPPPHAAARDDAAPGGPWLLLRGDHELAWDPHRGVAFVWTDDPDAARPQPVADGVRYLSGGRLWLRRPGTDAPDLLQSEASLDAVTLSDGRTLMSLADGGDRHRLVLLDESGAHATLVARDVARWSVTGDPPALAYTVADGPDAGVWLVPL